MPTGSAKRAEFPWVKRCRCISISSTNNLIANSKIPKEHLIIYLCYNNANAPTCDSCGRPWVYDSKMKRN